jgi:hypothetical protein
VVDRTVVGAGGIVYRSHNIFVVLDLPDGISSNRGFAVAKFRGLMVPPAFNSAIGEEI